MLRPQLYFKDEIDNSNSPFKPRIKKKPNALKPLKLRLEVDSDNEESFTHPYGYELDMFKPSDDQLTKLNQLKMPKSLDDVILITVQTENMLNSMMADLNENKEIGVDVERHEYRSYQGFTCLVQISTRDNDYIIDALQLRDKLHVLNEVFTDPNIVKVLHGAANDIDCLQRDLSVYIVNMFDTHQAALQLKYESSNLAYLVKKFCDVDCKRHLSFDWRTRPLPYKAIKYAREDSHYLLYIYDNLKSILVRNDRRNLNLLKTIINKSTEICKRKYRKKTSMEYEIIKFYKKYEMNFDNQQMYALKHLYQWRDNIAREEDESVMYVLPNQSLLKIAKAIPKNIQEISDYVCNFQLPSMHIKEIHTIMTKARLQPQGKEDFSGVWLRFQLFHLEE